MELELTNFDRLGLIEPLIQAIEDAGYEAPTPIQEKTIPLLLEGRDVIGQAQTGTGKTAAFALPILQKIDVNEKAVQALVLTPTRELGIQVAEAIFTYSKFMRETRVLPVYGGQSIQSQIRRLQKGVHVVVGTPGRIMDHLRRGTLSFANLKIVILDEADEMLRMGFLEDVEWILEQAPQELQKALFSATIPIEIRRIADRYLTNPATVEVEHKTLTVPTVQQRYIIVPEQQKVNALLNVLETEPAPEEAVLVFARTKVGAAQLAERLSARGCTADAMHGDMNQAQREQVIRKLRSGQLEVVVATDVAARGLDVERIGLVVNFDIPHDTESYVHRIGRTGRAGRAGKALLLITPRQKKMMRDIERYTGQHIEPMKVPSAADISARRTAIFKERVVSTIQDEDLELYLNLVEDLAAESEHNMVEIAAAALRLARGDKPLEVMMEPLQGEIPSLNEGMVRLFIDAGIKDGVRPADIVGAIANEADVPGNTIGAIDIFDRFSFVDVPARYIEQVLERMEGATIRSRNARIRVATPKEEDLKKKKLKHKGKTIYSKGKKKFKKRER